MYTANNFVQHLAPAKILLPSRPPSKNKKLTCTGWGVLKLLEYILYTVYNLSVALLIVIDTTQFHGVFYNKTSLRPDRYPCLSPSFLNILKTYVEPPPPFQKNAARDAQFRLRAVGPRTNSFSSPSGSRDSSPLPTPRSFGRPKARGISTGFTRDRDTDGGGAAWSPERGYGHGWRGRRDHGRPASGRVGRLEDVLGTRVRLVQLVGLDELAGEWPNGWEG